jgi:hypothetical protein
MSVDMKETHSCDVSFEWMTEREGRRRKPRSNEHPKKGGEMERKE